MSEVLRNATAMPIETVPAMITAGAGIVGAVVGARIERIKSGEGVGSEASDIVAHANMQPTVIKRAARYGLGAVALTWTVAGAINGYAYFDSDEPATTAANVSLVVDRSGATAFGEGKKKPDETANSIASIFDKADKDGTLKVTALVASSGEVTQIKPSEVKAVKPFGDAPMASAFRQGIEGVKLTSNTSSTTSEKKGAVVVVTNENSFGKNSDVIARAKDASASIYVVNIADSTGAQAKELQTVAEMSDGKYYEAKDLNASKVLGNIEDSVNSVEDQPGGPSKTPIKILGLLAIGGALLSAHAARFARYPDKMKRKG